MIHLPGEFYLALSNCCCCIWPCMTLHRPMKLLQGLPRNLLRSREYKASFASHYQRSPTNSRSFLILYRKTLCSTGCARLLSVAEPSQPRRAPLRDCRVSSYSSWPLGAQIWKWSCPLLVRLLCTIQCFLKKLIIYMELLRTGSEPTEHASLKKLFVLPIHADILKKGHAIISRE